MATEAAKPPSHHIRLIQSNERQVNSTFSKSHLCRQIFGEFRLHIVESSAEPLNPGIYLRPNCQAV